LKETEVGT